MPRIRELIELGRNELPALNPGGVARKHQFANPFRNECRRSLAVSVLNLERAGP